PAAETRAEERLLDILLAYPDPTSPLSPLPGGKGRRERGKGSPVRRLVERRRDPEDHRGRRRGPGAPPPHPRDAAPAAARREARRARGGDRGSAAGLPDARDDAAAPGHGGARLQLHRMAPGGHAEEEEAPHRAPPRGAPRPRRRGTEKARGHGRRGERGPGPRREPRRDLHRRARQAH